MNGEPEEAFCQGHLHGFYLRSHDHCAPFFTFGIERGFE